MASEPPIVAALEPAKERPQEAVERTTSSSSSIKQHESLPSQRTHNPPGPTQQPTIAAVGTGKYANGYHFPPKYPIKEQMRMGVVAFWSFYNTGFGFFFTVYALNVVGWGFMLLLLLVGAAPEMCWVNGRRDCDNIESPRRLWIEIDSQILTALFSATGFGLAPWRIRDLYLLLRYRINKDRKALRRLAGVHRHWLRLEGSDELQPTLGPKNIEETTVPYDTNSVPFPLEAIPDPPPTGIRAPPSQLWRMDFIAWLNIWYIVFQAFLSGFMWALSRYNRPPWTTGLFFALTFITSSAAGIMEVSQAMKVRAIEGVPLTKSDIRRLVRDKELGIPHYNNIKDKDPAEEERKKAEKKAKRTNRFSRRSEKPASDGTI
ncbi:putative alpha-l-rhamnosidase c protein [Rosellinia necatrix]|uniref:Putative alpha-l-rhamnosidase c protein n=1 Tax=Rosellinia necatrix TaxID=77044 RepID=A0A1W2TEW1_ROSNE|nr:putative alpha-l-rhamnosidase c protein [Rosellinia necatrix]